MSAKILDGRVVSSFLLSKVSRQVRSLKARGIFPKLAIILAGENPASLSYIKQKQAAAKTSGILCEQINFEENVKQEKLLKTIRSLNKNKRVHGILVQLPLPAGRVSTNEIISAIDSKKDVDGFNAGNVGKMFISFQNERLASCTAKGIIKLLEYYKISMAGKHVVVIGRSNIVGKPLAIMFLNRDATVTICHSKTQNLPFYSKQADILIAAVGRPRLVSARMVKKGAVVIDVGTTKVNGKLLGDVDFDKVKNRAAAITPVPGGIGPMTVACLMENVVIAASS